MPNTQGKPIRVLHILASLDRGGVETWLLEVIRKLDRTRVTIDFLVHTPKECAYDAEVKALGSQIFYGGDPSKPISYGRSFRRIVAENGPYDVVHSHVHH